MELLIEITTSPLYTILSTMLPEGLNEKIFTFIGAYILLSITIGKRFKSIEKRSMEHLVTIEHKFDALTDRIEDLSNVMSKGFKSGDERMTQIEERLSVVERKYK